MSMSVEECLIERENVAEGVLPEAVVLYIAHIVMKILLRNFAKFKEFRKFLDLKI